MVTYNESQTKETDFMCFFFVFLTDLRAFCEPRNEN